MWRAKRESMRWNAIVKPLTTNQSLFKEKLVENYKAGLVDLWV